LPNFCQTYPLLPPYAKPFQFSSLLFNFQNFLSLCQTFSFFSKYMPIIFRFALFTSQNGDPFVLVLLKYFHNTFTRCPRFSALLV
jgi:hypothetical protein